MAASTPLERDRIWLDQREKDMVGIARSIRASNTISLLSVAVIINSLTIIIIAIRVF